MNKKLAQENKSPSPRPADRSRSRSVKKPGAMCFMEMQSCAHSMPQSITAKIEGKGKKAAYGQRQTSKGKKLFMLTGKTQKMGLKDMKTPKRSSIREASALAERGYNHNGKSVPPKEKNIQQRPNPKQESALTVAAEEPRETIPIPTPREHNEKEGFSKENFGSEGESTEGMNINTNLQSGSRANIENTAPEEPKDSSKEIKVSAFNEVPENRDEEVVEESENIETNNEEADEALESEERIEDRKTKRQECEFNADSVSNPDATKRTGKNLSLIHICRCRRYAVCRSRWSPYH
eukprot:TRINITY_DN6098_c0_g1_i8.p2 TRINITY_DN6098_c0_g1~~TRINITY_DN6098_c0_g1_i8.p2  ORF type:complete len:293 (-),score=77.14 TRINITY_DN6098_c0_g1_i8:17-895(-)